MFVCWDNTRWHRWEMVSYHHHNPGDADDDVVVVDDDLNLDVTVTYL